MSILFRQFLLTHILSAYIKNIKPRMTCTGNNSNHPVTMRLLHSLAFLYLNIAVLSLANSVVIVCLPVQ